MRGTWIRVLGTLLALTVSVSAQTAYEQFTSMLGPNFYGNFSGNFLGAGSRPEGMGKAFLAVSDLYPAPMWQLRFDGKANTSSAKLEVIDDFNFKLNYAAPFGNLPAHLTRWEPVGNWPSIIAPLPYNKQFHNKYTDQAKLDEMAKANNLETWVQLYQQRCGPSQWGMSVWQFPSFLLETPAPTLSPWLLKDIPQEGLILMERNPYYWKVDLEGNQLPYIDNLRFDVIQTTDAAKLKLAQNELDFDTVFTILTKNKIRYQVIELTQPDTYEECAGNLRKSFEYLVKNY